MSKSLEEIYFEHVKEKYMNEYDELFKRVFNKVGIEMTKERVMDLAKHMLNYLVENNKDAPEERIINYLERKYTKF